MHVDLMRRTSGRLICQPHALPGEAAAFLSGSGHGEPVRTSAAAGRGPDRNLPFAMARDR
jgi:hypothetical protein